jgi:hypothetical protein
MKPSLAECLASLKKLTLAISEYPANRLFNHLSNAKTPQELFAVILELNYSSNSKIFRDGGPEEHHQNLNKITEYAKIFEDFFEAKITPNSLEQKQKWNKTILPAPSGKYAFRDDGSLRISLVDSELQGSKLHVKRMWTHVSNYDGSWTDFVIELDEAQIMYLNTRFEEVRVYVVTLIDS